MPGSTSEIWIHFQITGNIDVMDWRYFNMHVKATCSAHRMHSIEGWWDIKFNLTIIPCPYFEELFLEQLYQLKHDDLINYAMWDQKIKLQVTLKKKRLSQFLPKSSHKIKTTTTNHHFFPPPHLMINGATATSNLLLSHVHHHISSTSLFCLTINLFSPS